MTITTTDTRWATVCRLDDLLPGRGAAALVGDEQVAVFRLGGGEVRAIGNHDPVSGANVLSRGIVGTRRGRAVVASPMHKQAYDLETGVCLDLPHLSVPVFAARVSDGLVHVAVTGTVAR
jgi:nitrite reductase (NADH) small subunit